MIKYTDDIKEYVKNNHRGKSTIELSQEVNKKFGLNTTADKIQNLKTRIKRTGFIFEPARNDGCIKKGNVPINKGTKGMFNVGGNKTSFKKGNIPPNRREIGSERVTKDGFIEVKIQDGHLNKNWILKHRYIYEKYYGSIPKGYKVIFLDGNRKNFEIDNLKAISSHEELIMNEHNLRFKHKKLTESAYIIAQIESKRRQLKNERL